MHPVAKDVLTSDCDSIARKVDGEGAFVAFGLALVAAACDRCRDFDRPVPFLVGARDDSKASFTAAGSWSLKGESAGWRTTSCEVMNSVASLITGMIPTSATTSLMFSPRCLPYFSGCRC